MVATRRRRGRRGRDDDDDGDVRSHGAHIVLLRVLYCNCMATTRRFFGFSLSSSSSFFSEGHLPYSAAPTAARTVLHCYRNCTVRRDEYSYSYCVRERERE